MRRRDHHTHVAAAVAVAALGDRLVGARPVHGRVAADLHHIHRATHLDHAVDSRARQQAEVASGADLRMLHREAGGDVAAGALDAGKARPADLDVALRRYHRRGGLAAAHALGHQHAPCLADHAALDGPVNRDALPGHHLKARLHVTVDLHIALVADVTGAQSHVAVHQEQLADVDNVAIPAQVAVDSGRHLQAILRDDRVLAGRMADALVHARGADLLAEDVHPRLARLAGRPTRDDLARLHLADVVDVLEVDAVEFAAL